MNNIMPQKYTNCGIEKHEMLIIVANYYAQI